MEIVPLDAGCGAEARGADLNALTDSEVQAIAAAQAEHGVVFFRDQHLTPDEQLAAARRFGPINVNRFFTPLPEQPQVAMVLKEARHATNVGGGWHTDHSYDQVPALGSMLYAVEVPSVGGDTQFANMARAFETLPEDLKHRVADLKAVHSSRHIFGPKGFYATTGDDRYHNAEKATQDAVHPVVIRHPRSGRPVLYVNPGFTRRIEGLSDEDSAQLLGALYEHAQRPDHVCRFQWRPGSVAFWDNRGTWHYALNDYPGERRLMHRVTVDGEALAPYHVTRAAA